MDIRRWFMLNVVLALAVMFTTAVAGCSTPTDTSQSPTATAENSSDEWEGQVFPMETPEYNEEWPESGRDMVPGACSAQIDGKWVEVEPCSVIGQATRTERGTWEILRGEGIPVGFRGGGEERARGSAASAVNHVTGEIYIHHVHYWDADGNEVYKEYCDPLLNMVGPPPTPTPLVWLTTIEINPPYTDSIAVGKTIQFTAMGTYSDGSTEDITSQVKWSSVNWHATISPTGLATSMSTGDTFIFVNNMSGVGAHVYLDVR
ncbi:Ig-like domain-containing protein [Chloroflexota bacterium]